MPDELSPFLSIASLLLINSLGNKCGYIINTLLFKYIEERNILAGLSSFFTPISLGEENDHGSVWGGLKTWDMIKIFSRRS